MSLWISSKGAVALECETGKWFLWSFPNWQESQKEIEDLFLDTDKLGICRRIFWRISACGCPSLLCQVIRAESWEESVWLANAEVECKQLCTCAVVLYIKLSDVCE